MPRRLCWTSSSLVLTVGVVAAFGAVTWLDSAQTTKADAPTAVIHAVTTAFVSANPEFDAANVKGAVSCKKCHEAEYEAWTRTVHFKNHERLQSSAGQQYAQKYGNAEACQTCHSTPHTAAAQFAGPVGVSCESCHSPAGGADGWFDVHSNYGGENVKREAETEEHLQARMAACEKAGMIRAEDADALARNCYSCHIVADEKLLAAGHKPGQADFALIPWMQGEVRHNFQVDQKVNAESPSLLLARDGVTAEKRKQTLLVVGKLVELEVLLRNLASIDAKNLSADYAGRRGWAGRAEDVYDFIEKKIGGAIDNAHVKAAVAAVKDVKLGRRFEDQPGAKKAADKLAEISKAFVASSGETDLSGLNPLVKDLDKPKGTSYKP